VLGRITPVILSFLMLTAHFQRIYLNWLSLFVLLIPFILIYKKPVAVRIIQAILVLGSIEWIRIIFVYCSLRIENEEPWLRLAIILGVVALFTLASTLVFKNKKLKAIYGIS
ncbi:MAG: hypothetical protein GXO79_02720, partial [Chlorobi bacterium]|nr:hypothetical protein [Chlorobiota bacterium]